MLNYPFDTSTTHGNEKNWNRLIELKIKIWCTNREPLLKFSNALYENKGNS